MWKIEKNVLFRGMQQSWTGTKQPNVSLQIVNRGSRQSGGQKPQRFTRSVFAMFGLISRLLFHHRTTAWVSITIGVLGLIENGSWRTIRCNKRSASFKKAMMLPRTLDWSCWNQALHEIDVLSGTLNLFLHNSQYLNLILKFFCVQSKQLYMVTRYSRKRKYAFGATYTYMQIHN